MRKSALVLSLLVLCAAPVALAACGSDSDSSSSSTKTATVPSGQLGGTTCAPPALQYLVIAGMAYTGMECGEAQGLAATAAKDNKISGWTCSIRVSGSQTTTNCAQGSKTLQVSVRPKSGMGG